MNSYKNELEKSWEFLLDFKLNAMMMNTHFYGHDIEFDDREIRIEILKVILEFMMVDIEF
jgi:hypothetical protein